MKKAVTITTYIDLKYPGGMNKFLEDRGGICYLPEPTDLIYFIHPNLPEDIKKGLVGMFGNGIIFGTTWNFEGANQEDYSSIQDGIDAALNQADMGQVATLANPCVVAITCPSIRKDDPRIAKLIEKISTMPLMQRGCIICKNGYIPFEGTVPEFPKALTTVSIPKRETVINDDDILNLRIALESAHSLEEFLSKV